MTRDKAARPASDEKVIEKHLAALECLPYGPLLFDRTSALDFRLVELGETALADELALLEEKLAEAADGAGDAIREPRGLGRLLKAQPELRQALGEVLGRILPVLGEPEPEDLAGRVPVAVDLHLAPREAAGLPLARKRRIDASTN